MDAVVKVLGRNLFSVVEMMAKGVSWVSIVSLPFFIDISEFGVIALLYSMEIILCNLAVLGQDKYKLRNGPAVGDDPSYLIPLLFVLIISSPLLLWAYFGYKNSFSLIALLLVGTMFTVLNRVHVMEARVDNDVVTFSLHRLGALISRFGVFYLLLWQGIDPALAFMLGFAVSGFLVAAKKFLLTLPKVFQSPINGWPESTKSALYFGTPVAVHLLATSLLGNVDRFFINEYVGAHDVGVYAFSFMLASGVTFFYAALAVQIESSIYKYSEDEKRREYYIDQFGRYALCLVPVYCVALSVLAIVYEWVVGDFFEKTDLAVILVGVASFSMNIVYLKSSYRLYALKRSASISAVTVGACLVNVLLNWMLIPMFGIQAAAFGAFVSSTLLAMCMSMLSVSITGVKMPKVDIAIVLAAWLFSSGVLLFS
ncbi:hypothetical protein [Pseudomonas sp. FME51]|uniref:hypothetical protein n=1 Tax=Pseudomonas sp. FME51 TaxID=2742609 RepID=UPI001868F170|nr:hypothetical protein [Pseudomonas sp. FME51]